MGRRRNRGRHGMFICDRSGKQFPIYMAVREPGTGFVVHRRYSDGMFNIVDNPLNKAPPTRREGVPLPLMRPDINQANEADIITYSAIGTDYVTDENFIPIYY